MAVEILGLDHLYVSVSDFRRSEPFYDAVMQRLGFYKGDDVIGGEPHAHYFNRHLQYTIRPARKDSARHDPYSPGLHHVCFQVPNRSALDQVHRELAALGIQATEPQEYPEYNADYYATFFSDPDGIRLEVVARSRDREEISASWSRFRVFLNPLAELRAHQAALSSGGHLQGQPELTRYARVRRAGPLLFLAGISSRQADNSIKGARSDGTGALLLDVRAQTEGAIENLRRTLEEHGASLADVVDLTVFLTSMSDYRGFNEVYNRFFFAACLPTRTTIGVHQLPDPALCIELKAIAYRPERDE